MKKVFLGLFIFIVIAVGGFYIFINTGKSVDVTYEMKDYDSAMTKSAILVDDIQEINLITLAKKDFTTTGTNAIDATFSNSEMSALIDLANAKGGPIKDFRVAFIGNNQGEISFKLTDRFLDFIKEQNMIQLTNNKTAFSYFLVPLASAGSMTDTVVKFITNVAVNKPVYAKGTLSRTTENSVSIHIESLKVGQLSMSQNVVARVETEVLLFVNNLLSSTNGFMIEELRIENGALYYKGTLPAEIEGVKLPQ